MALSDEDMLPLGRLWREDGTEPDPHWEAAYADCTARLLGGLTDPDRIDTAVAGYRRRMGAARIKYRDLRPNPPTD